MPTQRPAAARHLDRWALRLARILGPLLGRPNERLLARLSGRRAGTRAPDHLSPGRAALDRGDLDAATTHFRSHTEQSPDDPWGWHGLGDALQLQGAHARALRAYDEAVARAPLVGLHHGARVNALESLGRREEAAAAWAKALELDSTLGWMRGGRPPPG